MRMHPSDAAIRAARLSQRLQAQCATPAQEVEPAILTPAVPAPQRGSKSANFAQRLLPATPAAGPSSSESAVPTLQRLRVCPAHAYSDCACLLSTLIVRPFISESDRVHCMDSGRCCNPTAIATSALLTHWQSLSLD